MDDTSFSLLLVGTIILIGLFGKVLSRRTRIPESFYLMLFGVAIGPVLGLVSTGDMLAFIPFFSVLALVIILIEAGIGFNIARMGRALPVATLFTLLVAVIATLIVSAMLHIVFGWEMLHALFMGIVCSGTTTIAAVALLEHLPKREYIKEIITLETVINDITIILGAVLIINLMLAADAGPSIVSSLFTQVSVGIFAGIIGSLIWKPVITNTIKRHLYSFTIGFAFVMYYLIEVLGGSPIIGILVFAIMIGNMPALFRLRDEKRNEFNELLKSVKDTQGDITFITKSFFFVVLGIVFSPASLSNSAVLLVVGAILAAVFASRYITASIISRIDKEIRKEKLLISGMMARGFVATVAAFLPAKYGIVIPNMTDIILLLVFGATLASIFVVSYCLRGERAADLQSA